MRILYDGAVTQERGAGGIKRYFTSLISRLPADFEPHFTTCRAREENEPSHPQLRVHRFRRFRPQRVSLKLEKLFLGRVEDSRSFTLAHPTYYTLLSQREVCDYPCPIVVTVWDMIHEQFPELDPGGFRERKRRAIEAADAVLCISESTKRDLLSHYPIDESKVLVTHLASDLDLSLIQGQERTPKRPYFLYLGGRAGYKNFDGLLSAFARASSVTPEFDLCVVGQPFNSAEAQRIIQLGLGERVENYGPVSDHQLAALYQHSLAFVYPSLYEGFGIPLLEAMQCGAPIIATNSSSIPEVVHDAAFLVNPRQEGELTNALLRLSRESTLRSSLIEKGFNRAREFSWDTTARRTLEVYERLAERG